MFRSLEQAADDMGITIQTARSYLKSLFTKTDTHRQADLIRLVMGSSLRFSELRGGRPCRHRPPTTTRKATATDARRLRHQ